MTIIRFFGLGSLFVSLVFAGTMLFRQSIKLQYTKTISVALSFIFLLTGFVFSDFSIFSVQQNSHTLQPLIYKIAAAWSHHEGSMLFWVVIMEIYVFLFFRFSNFEDVVKNYVIKIDNIVFFAILLYIALLSNPFALSEQAGQGLGLNPVLQDKFVAIHPPKLYFGYVGTSLIFAICLALLAKTNLSDDKNFKKLQPWIIIIWMMLTGGVVLGGNWAYRELGWGGFWSWDPVENISLVPWILMTIMFHANLFLHKKTTILSGATSFLSVIAGTGMVRSGNLVSLHSFAQDNTRLLGMLFIFIITASIAAAIYLKNSHKLNLQVTEGKLFELVRISNFLLIITVLIIGIGTIFPVLFSTKFVIDSHFFNTLCYIPAIVCLCLCAAVPIVKCGLRTKNILFSVVIFIVLFLLFYLRYNFVNFYSSAFYLIIATFVLISILLTFYVSVGAIWAHFGFALAIIGIVFPLAFGFENDLVITKKNKTKIQDYELELQDITYDAKDSYLVRKVGILCTKKGEIISITTPETRFYPIENTFTSETTTIQNAIDDLYFAVTKSDVSDKNNIKVYIHLAYRPAIQLLWIGCVMILIGMLISFSRNMLKK